MRKFFVSGGGARCVGSMVVVVGCEGGEECDEWRDEVEGKLRLLSMVRLYKRKRSALGKRAKVATRVISRSLRST